MRLLTRTKRYEGGMPPHTYLRRGFDLDPSCKLWLPFYKYGGEQTRIIDQSGNGNHGTISGTVPGIYPMLQPVASGSVTLANMKISAVNGTAFVDFSTVSVLTDYLNHLLVIKDSSGRVIQGYTKAAGTGETLSNAFADPMSSDQTALWEKSGVTLTFDTDHYHYAANGIESCIYPQKTVTAGKLYKQTTQAKDGTYAPTDMKFYFYDSTGGLALKSPPIDLTASFASYNWYVTCLTTFVNSGRCGYFEPSNPGGNYFELKLFSFDQVLTPSATGVTIVSTKGGATFNWASKDANFNYNDSSGYTYTIYSVPGYMGLGWFGDGSDDRVVHSSLNLGTTHTLHYWLLYQGISGVIHGGAANYHGLRLTPTACGYNVGTTEVTVTHSANYGEPVLFSIDRNGTSVDFYKNGVKIGATQTLGANTALVLTDFFRYSDGTSYWNGILFDSVDFNTNKGALAIRNFFELTRARHGV